MFRLKKQHKNERYTNALVEILNLVLIVFVTGLQNILEIRNTLANFVVSTLLPNHVVTNVKNTKNTKKENKRMEQIQQIRISKRERAMKNAKRIIKENHYHDRAMEIGWSALTDEILEKYGHKQGIAILWVIMWYEDDE